MRDTAATTRVILALYADIHVGRSYGYELMRRTKLMSGSLYPILARLQTTGLVEKEWEDLNEAVGRPPRRYYKLTGTGVRKAEALVQGLPGGVLSYA